MSRLPTTPVPADPGVARRGRIAQARDRGNAASQNQVRDAIPDLASEVLELRTVVDALRQQLREQLRARG